MTLGEKQRLFSEHVALLILQAVRMGYQVTWGEAWRPPETAELYAKQGRGIKRSLHQDRLAVDLNLFKDGQYLQDTSAHQPLGEWWEKQHELARWGGRFKDGNHYSFEHEGRA